MLHAVGNLSPLSPKRDDPRPSLFSSNDHLGKLQGPQSDALRTNRGPFTTFRRQRRSPLLRALGVGEGTFRSGDVLAPDGGSAGLERAGFGRGLRGGALRVCLPRFSLLRTGIVQREKRHRNRQSAQKKPHRGPSMPTHALSATKQQPTLIAW